MKIERTKNAGKNILFGTVLRVYQILVPFAMRTALIYILGAQYLGLNSLFSSVLQVLNLAELGVGNAMVYSMYKPIAEDDTATICALMALYRKYYRIIGLVILCTGLCITPLLPKLIKMNTVPEGINIYILYLLNLGATVISYWLFAYKNCLLTAFQRVDITSKISLIVSFLGYVLQFVVLLILHNFYLYTVVLLITGIINNIVTAIVVDRLFPGYHPSGVLPEEEVKTINGRVRDLFTSKIGSVIYDSADTIVISAFLGMTVLAIFQNYYFILTSITGFIAVVFTACSAGIGNSLVVETKAKNYNDLTKFSFIICWISCFCSSCLLCLYQPFMELWVGRDLMLEFSAVVCIVLYFYIRQINSLLNLYKDASGMWHEDRFRPLCAALTNLILNLLLVRVWGIYGVLLSTVFAILFVGVPWLLHNLFTVIFEKHLLGTYLRKLGIYVIMSFIICTVTYLICNLIQKTLLITFLLRLLLCAFLPNILFYLSFRHMPEFKQSIELADNMTKKRFHKILMHLGGVS